MKLSKALKVKNRIVGQVAKLEQIVSRENSRRDDNPSKIDVAEVYKQWGQKSSELVKVKAAIAVANTGIYAKIAEMEERKNHISKLEYLSVREGPEIDMIGYGNQQVKKEYLWSATINDERRDQLIKDAQDKINNLQDEIDEFNASTDVNF